MAPAHREQQGKNKKSSQTSPAAQALTARAPRHSRHRTRVDCLPQTWLCKPLCPRDSFALLVRAAVVRVVVIVIDAIAAPLSLPRSHGRHVVAVVVIVVRRRRRVPLSVVLLVLFLPGSGLLRVVTVVAVVVVDAERLVDHRHERNGACSHRRRLWYRRRQRLWRRCKLEAAPRSGRRGLLVVVVVVVVLIEVEPWRHEILMRLRKQPLLLEKIYVVVDLHSCSRAHALAELVVVRAVLPDPVNERPVLLRSPRPGFLALLLRLCDTAHADGLLF
eukprot:Amastigsp_a339951_77.p4 type:complete len:275 gc:universal Amastigsp_a339951_77:1779-2603(+)